METSSRATNWVLQPRYWRWVRYLLIAKVLLLILIMGSVGLFAAWVRLNDDQPWPASSTTLAVQPKRSLATAATKPCIVRSVETAAAGGRTCISEH